MSGIYEKEKVITMTRNPIEILKDSCDLFERLLIELSIHHEQMEDLLAFLEDFESIDL